MSKIAFFIMLVCLGICVSLRGVSTVPSESKILGTFGVWTAYEFNDANGKVCYMSSQPTDSQGKYTSRDDVFLTITHRPDDKSYDVVNLTAGFTYKKASKPTLRIDNKKAITLVPVNDMAWASDAKTDVELVSQMIIGGVAYANGESARGTKITDTFSLKGFGKAYAAINSACHH